MLVELRCDKFRQNLISFHPGLNVIIGDDQAANSIGKSCILMIIDFVFGGDSLLKHNSDIVEELGDHDYYFELMFNMKSYYFRRGTYRTDLVYKCDGEYKDIAPISINEYRTFLKSAYELNQLDLTFRSTVSLFSRVWGKENLDVKQPLHSFKKQTAVDCIDNLLKLYDRYKSIRVLSKKIKDLSNEKSTINKAYNQDLIPKISKTKYKRNVDEVTRIDKEIQDIKNNLAKYAVNINEIINREVFELKAKKDTMLSERAKVLSRLTRVRNDLNQNKHIRSKAFSGLVRFFPDVDSDRVAKVEEFHSKISRILRKELKESEIELSDALNDINSVIHEIDTRLEAAFANVNNPEAIVDRVQELCQNHTTAVSENRYYETDDRIRDELKVLKSNLTEEKMRVLNIVENVINDKIRQYVDRIYIETRKSPILSLSQNSYTFSVIDDTGTGKAYSNLVLFDMAVLETTELPILIHDSVLYKNIENTAVAELVKLYIEIGKQSFISIDEIQKYGTYAVKMLFENKVLELTDDMLLFIKDWRKKTS